MKCTILHVEDDPSDADLVAHAFRKVASEVDLRRAEDGEKAVAYLAGAPPFADRALHPLPHLVLLDLKLPLKSGFEVLEWIRTRPPLASIPVFILSSSSESSDIHRAYALGANSFLVKNVDLATLRHVVRGIGDYARIVAETSPEIAADPRA